MILIGSPLSGRLFILPRISSLASFSLSVEEAAWLAHSRCWAFVTMGIKITWTKDNFSFPVPLSPTWVTSFTHATPHCRSVLLSPLPLTAIDQPDPISSVVTKESLGKASITVGHLELDIQYSTIFLEPRIRNSSIYRSWDLGGLIFFWACPSLNWSPWWTFETPYPFIC